MEQKELDISNAISRIQDFVHNEHMQMADSGIIHLQKILDESGEYDLYVIGVRGKGDVRGTILKALHELK